MSLRFVVPRATPGQVKVVEEVVHHVSRRTPVPAQTAACPQSAQTKVVAEYTKDNSWFWYCCGEQRRCQALEETLVLCKLPVTARNRP